MSEVNVKPAEVNDGVSAAVPKVSLRSRDGLLAVLRTGKRESLILLLPVTVAIVGLAAYTSAETDTFLTKANFLTILVQAAPLGIIAVGMTLLMAAGLLDVSVGAVASFVAVVAATSFVGGWPTIFAVVFALALATGISIVFGMIAALTKVDVFIFTLGAMSVFTALALVAAGGKPVPTGDLLAALAFGKFLGIPYPVITMLAVAVAGILILRYTRLGRNAYAVGSNEDAAFVSGVPIVRVKAMLFAISGLFVGVAALVLLARLGAGDPRAGIGLELQAIAAVILGGGALSGGRGSVLGTLLGVFLLSQVQNALNLLNVDSAYQTAFQGGILMAAVLFIAINAMSRSGKKGLRFPRILKPSRTVQR